MRYFIAWDLEVPHISEEGFNPAHTFGRSGEPKILQRWRSSSWMQGVLAGLPSGIPGIGLEIDGAVQHAPQSGRQSIIHSLFIAEMHLITFSQIPRIPLA